MAERQVVHLARLVDDLMDVARISRGKIELRKEAVDLATVVGQAVETARPLIDERRHDLTVSLPDEAIRLEADPTRLEQVLWNLLNNAAKYTEPGGRIGLSRRAGRGRGRRPGAGHGHRHRAGDAAPGLRHVRPGRASTRTHAQGGLGIGLSLVQDAGRDARRHDHGAQRGAGHGQRVRRPAARPRRQPGEVATPERAVAGAPGGRPPRRRILVVDDNVDAAVSLARLLARLYGQEVRVAHDGPEALAVAGEFRPEVVLLDIGLPGMDGYEVARRLRERPEFEGTLLVALTGWGQEADVAEVQGGGLRSPSGQAGEPGGHPRTAPRLRGVVGGMTPYRTSVMRSGGGVRAEDVRG